MGCVAPVAIRSALFLQDEIVDESTDQGMSLHHPGKLNRAQLALKPLEQTHEIPDRENMLGLEVPDVLHERQELLFLTRIWLDVFQLLVPGVDGGNHITVPQQLGE